MVSQKKQKIDLKELQNLLSTPQKILITSHFKPDGDAIGSSLGLFNALKKLGHTVEVMMPSIYPDFLQWLPGNDQIMIFNQNIPKGVEVIQGHSLIFCLDFNELGRTNQMEVYLRDSEAIKIMIDHHLEPDDFAAFTISEPKASSTCELIYDFLQNLPQKDLIDKDVANCLMTGLITDTGRFKHALSPNVFKVASELLAFGAEIDKINEEIFDSFSEDKLRLQGFSLSDRMVIIPEHKSAYIYLSVEDYKRFNFKIGDNEGLVNMPLGIKNIVFSTLISETDDVIKFSFRSKGDFATNEFAKKHFNGGGHKNASGGKAHGNFKDIISKFEKLIPLYSEELNK